MPFSTYAKSKSRKRTYRRKGPVKRSNVNARVAGLEKSVRKLAIKEAKMKETKFLDAAANGTTVTTTATVNGIFTLPVGTGDSQRVGNRVWMKSFFLRLAVTPNATAGLNFLRFIVFKDRQCNGSAPAASDLLTSSTNYLSPLLMDNNMRFKILFDRIYTVDSDATGAQVDKVYRKLKFPVEFQDTTSAAISNGLFILMISDQATNGPTVSYQSRLKYTDA